MPLVRSLPKTARVGLLLSGGLFLLYGYACLFQVVSSPAGLSLESCMLVMWSLAALLLFVSTLPPSVLGTTAFLVLMVGVWASFSTCDLSGDNRCRHLRVLLITVYCLVPLASLCMAIQAGWRSSSAETHPRPSGDKTDR